MTFVNTTDAKGSADEEEEEVLKYETSLHPLLTSPSKGSDASGTIHILRVRLLTNPLGKIYLSQQKEGEGTISPKSRTS